MLAFHSALDARQWDVVRDIINLTGDRKLDRDKIELSLVQSIKVGQFDITRDIINLTGDNKPRSTVMKEAVKAAILQASGVLFKIL